MELPSGRELRMQYSHVFMGAQSTSGPGWDNWGGNSRRRMCPGYRSGPPRGRLLIRREMETGTAPSRTARQRGRSRKAAWLAALAGAALLVPVLTYGPAAAGPDAQIGCVEPYSDMETACPAFDGAVDFGVLRDAALPGVYRLDVTAPNTRVVAQLIDVPVDYDLYVTDAAGTELGRSANPGGANEAVTITAGPGTYFAYV